MNGCVQFKQHHPVKNLDDILLWESGIWCEKMDYLAGKMSHMANDYVILARGTQTWLQFAASNDLLKVDA